MTHNIRLLSDAGAGSFSECTVVSDVAPRGSGNCEHKESAAEDVNTITQMAGATFSTVLAQRAAVPGRAQPWREHNRARIANGSLIRVFMRIGS